MGEHLDYKLQSSLIDSFTLKCYVVTSYAPLGRDGIVSERAYDPFCNV